MKSIIKSIKFMAGFTAIFLFFLFIVTAALAAVFAPFGAGFWLGDMGYHPAVCFLAGFLIVLGYVVVAERLGHLDDLLI